MLLLEALRMSPPFEDVKLQVPPTHQKQLGNQWVWKINRLIVQSANKNRRHSTYLNLTDFFIMITQVVSQNHLLGIKKRSLLHVETLLQGPAVWVQIRSSGPRPPGLPCKSHEDEDSSGGFHQTFQDDGYHLIFQNKAMTSHHEMSPVMNQYYSNTTMNIYELPLYHNY